MQFFLGQNEEGKKERKKEAHLTDASHITYCVSGKTL